MSKRRCRWAAALGAVCLAGAVAAPAHADWRAFRGPNAGHHRPVCGNAAAGQARCLASVNTSSTGKPLAAAGPAGYNPAQLQGAYSLTSASSTSGVGQTVAIVDAYHDPNAEADLATYRSQFGLPACTKANGCFRQLNQNGATSPLPAGDVGWSEEISLDLDMVSAVCPNCHILLVEATSPTLANLATAVNTAVRLGATEVSNSYGGSESGASYYASAYNHPRVAITASAGDDGYGVSFPASAKTVTAVGGTSLTLNSGNGRASETVWSGTGSGCSRTFTQPAWQTSRLVAGVCSRRVVGDVAAVADPGTGVSVYDTYGESGWLVFGGTSVSAPIIASVYALAGNAGSIGSTGEPLPYVYGTGTNLFDVTSGRNGSCGGSYLCTARAGYDGPTGLGTPIGVSAF
jgi:subtilase family serine protease